MPLNKEFIPDERYYIADKAICDAFFQLVKEKDISKITVADVIKKAGIVRSTFYNHYENIPDLISSIENQTVSDVFSMMQKFKPRNNQEFCKSFFMSICEYTKSNPLLISLLCNPDTSGFYEKTISMFQQYVSKTTSSRTPSNHSKKEFSYMLASTIGSTIGVLHKWARNDFAESSEYIADILARTFIAGTLPFIS
ncbi:MAG: TetR/AcrR family transcriptional regulator [Blautia sp.]|nr:TetR/AcrR family transcriptional regulator [Blautia sp.]